MTGSGETYGLFRDFKHLGFGLNRFGEKRDLGLEEKTLISPPMTHRRVLCVSPIPSSTREWLTHG